MPQVEHAAARPQVDQATAPVQVPDARALASPGHKVEAQRLVSPHLLGRDVFGEVRDGLLFRVAVLFHDVPSSPAADPVYSRVRAAGTSVMGRTGSPSGRRPPSPAVL